MKELLEELRVWFLLLTLVVVWTSTAAVALAVTARAFGLISCASILCLDFIVGGIAHLFRISNGYTTERLDVRKLVDRYGGDIEPAEIAPLLRCRHGGNGHPRLPSHDAGAVS